VKSELLQTLPNHYELLTHIRARAQTGPEAGDDGLVVRGMEAPRPANESAQASANIL
jgi:hypothetical protein